MVDGRDFEELKKKIEGFEAYFRENGRVKAACEIKGVCRIEYVET